MKLFLLLGNQLFSPKYLNDFKDHAFFMAEDYDNPEIFWLIIERLFAHRNSVCRTLCR